MSNVIYSQNDLSFILFCLLMSTWFMLISLVSKEDVNKNKQHDKKCSLLMKIKIFKNIYFDGDNKKYG